jgi:hypothetical protein
MVTGSTGDHNKEMNMNLAYWGDVIRLVAFSLATLLLLYLIYGQWVFHRKYAHTYQRREFWRYGHGDALHERYRVIELLEAAARGCEQHGLADRAQGMRDAASLVAQPHLIDKYVTRQLVLPYWLADFMRDHRAQAALFGERKESDSGD